MKESEVKNILVYRSGHLGDTIAALPAFRAIRKKFPGARLTLLTNADGTNKNYIAAKNVIPERGLFDSYKTYDNSAGGLGKALSFARLFAELRREKYDVLFYLMPRVRTSKQVDRDLKFFRAAGIRTIYGAGNLKENRLDFESPRPLPRVEPESEFLLDCLPFEKISAPGEMLDVLLLSENEKDTADGWLEKNCGLNFREMKIIAVAPGSKWDSKKWFEDRFTEVLTELIAEFGVFPVIFGGGEDFDTGRRILEKLPSGANAAGKLSIREGLAALKRCRMYLGNDTGTMHMAAAAGVPVVGIFAAIDFPGRWIPFGTGNEILRQKVECEGCHTAVCFNNKKCLDLISTRDVFRACEMILSR